VVASVLAVALVVAILTADRWLMAAMRPGPFDADETPPAPDYSDTHAWAALPETEDAADVFLPEHPAIDQTTAPVAVFYVHPTTFVGAGWNAPIDDPVVMEATARGGTLIQASAFNACCAVYAPRYRQAHGHAYVFPDADGERAIEIAYSDVSTAFDAFLERAGGRPFIVAAHSQGAVLAARLIRERIAGQELLRRLVAAYLPGAPIRAGRVDPEIPICQTPAQIGCFASWHARGPAYQPNRLEFDADDPETMMGRACVNPITWTTDGAYAPAEQHAGAIFFDTEVPVVKPAFADAQCVDGSLVITRMGNLERDFVSKLLLWLMGPDNYHPIEYQLFYLDIRKNALDRVEAFIGGA